MSDSENAGSDRLTDEEAAEFEQLLSKLEGEMADARGGPSGDYQTAVVLASNRKNVRKFFNLRYRDTDKDNQ